MKRQWILFLVLAASALLPSRVLAQPERYEAGRRLGLFERAWEKQPDDAARKKALASLRPIPLLFIAGKYGEAGKAFDRARWALAGDKGYTPQVAWAESLSWVPDRHLLDNSTTELPFALRHFYESKSPLPENSVLRMKLVTVINNPAVKTVEVPIKEVPFAGKLPLPGVIEGDHLVHIQIVVDNKVAFQTLVGVSLVKDLKERMTKLQQAVAGFGRGSLSVEQLTVSDILASLVALDAKQVLETDYPAARLLKEAEAVVEAIAGSKRYYSGDKTGQFWLHVAGRSPTPLRMFVPESAKEGKPLPLVIALHGLGGSEDLVFEGYGAGLTVKMCKERGWLLAAPRKGAALSTTDLVDELARIYPVDKTRVFLIGHSIGGRQAMKAAELAPERFAAVAALGCGAAVTPKKAPPRDLPVFIGVGTADLVYGLANKLYNRLKKAGLTHLEYHEYAGIEHLLIVREALPDVFAMFDKVVAGK